MSVGLGVQIHWHYASMGSTKQLQHLPTPMFTLQQYQISAQYSICPTYSICLLMRTRHLPLPLRLLPPLLPLLLLLQPAVVLGKQLRVLVQ